MKLFVDYTNHNDIREWREIEPCPMDGEFLTIKAGLYPRGKPEEPKRLESTFVLNVSMKDRRGARRTLRVDQIHGFRVED